jgi:hypothetical protein
MILAKSSVTQQRQILLLDFFTHIISGGIMHSERLQIIVAHHHILTFNAKPNTNKIK